MYKLPKFSSSFSIQAEERAGSSHAPQASGNMNPIPVNEKAANEAAQAIDGNALKKGKRIVAFHKWTMTIFLIAANSILIFASWYWPQFYYLYLPWISMPLVLNSIMVFSVIVYKLKNMIFKPRKIVPPTPETLVLLMPCYNETEEECSRSLTSLAEQVDIDQHQKAIMVICDGKVRGPDMAKTTAQYLTEDILNDPANQRTYIRAAYVAWDGQTMDVEVVKGVFRGIPFYCIIKQQNQGKRDSLIVVRSFVHKYNQRAQRPRVIFSPVYWNHMAGWLQNDVGMDKVDNLIGMDADTVFKDDCISHLIEESRYPQTVGVCGFVSVDFSHGRWNLWSIYQSTEYTIAQALRRLHQSVATHKVSCLPGCCQLLKVQEESCGDRILIDLFGYHPRTDDSLLRRIRATASEDRNHVCLMLIEYPQVQCRQALNAKAFTDVPHSMDVFRSQRRRWTLGATSNDLMLFTRANLYRFNWWERIIAFSNVVTWCLNYFVIASLACMIYAFIQQPLWIIMIFVSVMLIPIVYYILLVFWVPKTLVERFQYLLGLFIFTVFGPFLNVYISFYAVVHMDNFGWGKTRMVVAESGEAEEPNAREENDRLESAAHNPERVIYPKASSSSSIQDDVEKQAGGARLPWVAEPPAPRE